MEQEEETFKPMTRIRDLKTEITLIVLGNVLYVSKEYFADMVLRTSRYFIQRKFNN